MHSDKEYEQSVPLAHAGEDDVDSEYGSQSSSTPFNGQPIRQRRRSCGAYLCTLLGYVLCAAIFTFIGAQITRHNLDLDARCAGYTSKYSPVVKEVDVKYSMKQFNGTFMVEDIYRRPGSPEVDAAWEEIGLDARPGIISKEEGLASGLGPGHVQIAEKYGGGFIVNVEGMHHLHCLNLLRKSLYFNFDYYKKMGHHAFSNDDEILHLHVTHCLDTIRQVLMCSPDTSVLGQVWSVARGGEGSHGGGQHPSHPLGGGSGHGVSNEAHEHAGDRSSGNHDQRTSTFRSRRVRRHGDDDASEEEGGSSTTASHPVHKQTQGSGPHPQAFPDFNTQHKCKNFDAIRAYALAIQAPPNEMLPPDFLAKADPAYVVMGTP